MTGLNFYFKKDDGRKIVSAIITWYKMEQLQEAIENL